MSCVSKADEGGKKTQKKSKCSVLCGQQILKDTSGESISDKESCVFMFWQLNYVCVKNLERLGMIVTV